MFSSKAYAYLCGLDEMNSLAQSTVLVLAFIVSPYFCTEIWEYRTLVLQHIQRCQVKSGQLLRLPAPHEHWASTLLSYIIYRLPPLSNYIPKHAFRINCINDVRGPLYEYVMWRNYIYPRVVSFPISLTQECSSTIFRPWCEMVIVRFSYDRRPRLFVRGRHIQFERIADPF